jgi:hypothetical protein
MNPATLSGKCDSNVVLPGTLGPDRVKLFMSMKKGVLDGCMPSGACTPEIPVSVDAFLQLLTLFANSSKNYEGMRVYFGCYLNPQGPPPSPPGQEGQLCLLFVPTIGKTASKSTDDTGSYYVLYDGMFTPVPAFAVYALQARYSSYIVPVLEAFGKNLYSEFRETHSLWYSMDSIKGTSDDIGLIEFIKCHQNDQNPIVKMNIQLSCFLHSEDQSRWPYFQSTVIFDLIQRDDPKVLIQFGSADLSHSEFYSADTGVPCPPFGSC